MTSNAAVMKTIEELADFLARAFESGSLRPGWTKPWRAVPRCRNPTTGGKNHEFSYLNSLLLWVKMQEKEYRFPLWATLKQWNADGRWVRRGETATTGLRPLRDQRDGSLEGPDVGVQAYAPVQYFNIEQTIGEIPADADLLTVAAEPFAEFLKSTLQVKVEHDSGGARYSHKDDIIGMPLRDRFLDNEYGTATEHYYGALLHEMVHWTGRFNRLKRRGEGELRDSKSAEYAFEELVAEFGSAQLCIDLKVSTAVREDHVQYLAHWAKALRAKPSDLLRAVSEARKARDYLIVQAGRQALRSEVGVVDLYPRAVASSIFQKNFPVGVDALELMLRRGLLTPSSANPEMLERGSKWGGLDGTSMARLFRLATGMNLQ